MKPGGPIRRGGQFHLSCSVTGAVDPKFIWYKDGRYLINATMANRFMRPDVRVTDSAAVGVLTVHEAGEWDNGRFYCRVRTGPGGTARLRPRFSLLMSGTLLSLPICTWAGGNLAEWA